MRQRFICIKLLKDYQQQKKVGIKHEKIFNHEKRQLLIIHKTIYDV